MDKVVSLVRHEGTLLYSDDHCDNVQVVSCITITRFLGRPGESPVMVRWHPEGELTGIAESIAIYLSREPGLKDVIDGIYSMIVKRKAAQ